MTYGFNVSANFLPAQLFYSASGVCAVLPRNVSENPLRQRTLPRSFGEPGSWLANLHNALVEHGIGYFYEASDVRANYEIAGVSVLFRSVPCVFEDRRHDVAQP